MTNRWESELVGLREQLQLRRVHISDPELLQEVEAWIADSYGETDADTAREYVEQRLNELLVEHPMYHAPDLERGVDGFPDDCSDCEHYGSACPVLRDRVEVRHRERTLEEATTEDEERAVLRQQAIDTGCLRIPAFLEAWDSEFEEHAKAGQELLERVDEHLETATLAIDTDGETPELALGGGPGGE